MKNEDEGLSIEQIYADGSTELVDLSELFEISDAFASMYGLGSSKNLTDFVQKVNNEDPLVIEGMMNAAAIRLEKQYGDGSKSVHRKIDYGIDETISNLDSQTKDKLQKTKGQLVNFLRQMGTSDKEIKDGLSKIESGKIKVSENDYSWITPDILNSPNFDFEATLKKMSEDRKNSVQIKVSHEKYERKCKEDLEKEQKRHK